MRKTGQKVKVFLILFLFMFVGSDILSQDPSQTVRVWLRVFRKRSQLKIINPYGMIINSEESLKKKIFIKINSNRLVVNGKNYTSVFLYPVNKSCTIFETKFGKKRYSGFFRITINNNELHIINTTPVNDYLKGVVGAELGDTFHLETLKAQAVVSRTYLYYNTQKLNRKEIDAIDSDGHFQSYRGLLFVSSKVERAVEETSGLVLRSDERGFVPYFHSTCGGMLLSPSESWSNKPIIVSKIQRRWDGPRKKPNCKLSPYFTWKAELTHNAVIQALRKQTKSDVQDLEFNFNRYGFCNKVILKLADKSVVVIKGFMFKAFLERQGISAVRSVRFNVTKKGMLYCFEGKGFGHLVGMCQWGAESLARQGMRFHRILRYYYPNARITGFNH